jgi:hypothetical protein
MDSSPRPRRISFLEGIPVTQDERGHFHLLERPPLACRHYSCGCECKECLKRASGEMKPKAIRQPWEAAA